MDLDESKPITTSSNIQVQITPICKALGVSEMSNFTKWSKTYDRMASIGMVDGKYPGIIERYRPCYTTAMGNIDVSPSLYDIEHDRLGKNRYVSLITQCVNKYKWDPVDVESFFHELEGLKCILPGNMQRPRSFTCMPHHFDKISYEQMKSAKRNEYEHIRNKYKNKSTEERTTALLDQAKIACALARKGTHYIYQFMILERTTNLNF